MRHLTVNATGGLLVAVTLLVAAGCVRQKIEIAPEDTTGKAPSGMVPVRGIDADEVWAKAGINLARYNRILIAPPDLQFRAVKRVGPGKLASDYPVADDDRQRLADTFSAALREALAGSRRFSIVESSGPGVLLLNTNLTDIVSHVAPDEPGREQIYVDVLGSARLTLALADAETGERLAEATERRAEADPFDDPQRLSAASTVNSVTAWAEIRRSARRLATAVARTLDQLHTQGRMPGSGDSPP